MSEFPDRDVTPIGPLRRPTSAAEASLAGLPTSAGSTAEAPTEAAAAAHRAATTRPSRAMASSGAADQPSNERLRAILDSHPSAIVVVDQSGRISYANPRTPELLGYEPGELIGMPVDLLVREASRARHALDRSSYVAGPQTREMGTGRDLTARRKNGELVPVEIGLSSASGRTADRHPAWPRALP